MRAWPIKLVVDAGAGDESDRLFHEVQSLSDHELQLTIGAVKRPKLPLRWCHPVSVKFSALGEAEFAALREDIRVNGQRKAIAMLDGRIWDGRSRYDACIDLGLIPKIWPLHRGSPIIYLLQRHGTRYGGPNSPERDAALAVLREIEGSEWQRRAEKERDEWIAEARRDFKNLMPHPLPCAACGLARDYSHAHHLLPLGLQYELGVDAPIQEHEWLCHVHHKAAHRLISARLRGARNSESWQDDEGKYLPADERAVRPALIASFNRTLAIYQSVGGIMPRGNAAMLSP